jgi:hypothetical protein
VLAAGSHLRAKRTVGICEVFDGYRVDVDVDVDVVVRVPEVFDVVVVTVDVVVYVDVDVEVFVVVDVTLVLNARVTEEFVDVDVDDIASEGGVVVRVASELAA